jgi:hypothetical protein
MRNEEQVDDLFIPLADERYTNASAECIYPEFVIAA